MLIKEKPIEYYIDRIKNGDSFSVAGFSDAEWFCMLNQRVDQRCAPQGPKEGQLMTADTGRRLRAIFGRREGDDSFIFAIPKVIKHLFSNQAFNLVIRDRDFTIHERDMITDELSEKAEMWPFIEQLQKSNVVLISNKHLRGLDFLGFDKFIEVSSPDFHLDKKGIDKVVKECLSYGKPGVYLFSSGFSAALMIDKLHGQIPGAVLFDSGSMWDAFVGIGAQRQWRADLYNNPDKLLEWKKKNLNEN